MKIENIEAVKKMIKEREELMNIRKESSYYSKGLRIYDSWIPSECSEELKQIIIDFYDKKISQIESILEEM